jgi:hypothetical protein
MIRKAQAIFVLVPLLLAAAAPRAQAQAQAQDFSRYEALKNPRIITMPDQKMLVVESKGDPNVSASTAFTLLFRSFFGLPGARMTSAPRARWTNKLTDPKAEWVGLYAMPLPESVTALPAGMTGVRIEAWTYGEVAEILHVGPYADEAPTVQKLMAFITDKGYAVAGPHEEEYLRGPGQAPSPAEYLTIIRYQVKKK